MNKRMKDPKGDLRFVHKSTRVYDFWSLKLTAMACLQQAGSVYFHCISTFYFKSAPIFWAYKAGLVLYTFLKALKND
jgi:hypothetical protein